MSREIKFRAWHKEDKQFIGFHTYGFCMWENGQIYVDGMNVTNRVELDQFTGLKDRNGKDIYEGDGVKVFMVDHGYWLGVVKFIDGCFEIQFDATRDYLKCYTCNHAVEIVGNIHEAIK